MEGAGEGRAGDVRIPLAAAGLILLATLVVVVVLTGGSSARDVDPAPAPCLSLWNADPKAVAFGRHNFREHDYRQAEVTSVDRAGNATRRGRCAVVFPSPVLDPERFAAASIHLRGGWRPLNGVAGMDSARLAKLQAEALQNANATLRSDGRLDSF